MNIDEYSFSEASDSSKAYLNSLHRYRPALERSFESTEKRKKESVYSIITKSKYYTMTNSISIVDRKTIKWDSYKSFFWDYSFPSDARERVMELARGAVDEEC